MSDVPDYTKAISPIDTAEITIRQKVEYHAITEKYLNFILAYAPYFYYNDATRSVDIGWGRGPLPAADAILFLGYAYVAAEFDDRKTEVYNKVVEIADYLLSIQCTDPVKYAYGGFKSTDTSTYYYSGDAMRAIMALLKAYDLTGNSNYYNAAVLAGGTFLYNMQHKPYDLGIVDAYYGGFVEAVTIADAYVVFMATGDLYGLVCLQDLYTRTANAKYQTMIADMLPFYRTGLEKLYNNYKPKPYGDNLWHRQGTPETNILTDGICYALLGLYSYEGWTASVRDAYDTINDIMASVEYPDYNPKIGWSGYIDVVNLKPACNYYDNVTASILYDIRNTYDISSLKTSFTTLLSKPESFMYWGAVFADLSPIQYMKSTVTVAWIGMLLLRYSSLSTPLFVQLQHEGVNIDPRQMYTWDGTTWVKVRCGSGGDSGKLLVGDTNVKTAVDLTKTAVDAVKGSTDVIQTKVDAVKTELLTGAIKSAVDLTKTAVDSTKAAVDSTKSAVDAVKATLKDGTTLAKIATAAAENIVIDKLTQSAYVERRTTLSNNGDTPTWNYTAGSQRLGKYFSRGGRGFVESIDVYCKDNGASGGTITVYLAPYIGATYVCSAIITVPAGGAEAWRSATFNRMWNYDSMFIFIFSSSSDMYFAQDAGSPPDRYNSMDSGATWTVSSGRIWARANMFAQTVGDVPVSGLVAVAKHPAKSSGVLNGDTAIKSAPGLVYWITCEAGANASVFQLNDSTDNSGTDQWQAKVPANDSRHFVFDPPLAFKVGVYLDVDANVGSCTVGYE